MASTSECGDESGAVQEQIQGRPSKRRKRTWGDVFCPHCSKTVSKTTYYRHRQAFYNRFTNVWNTKGCMSDSSSSDSDLRAGLEDEVLDENVTLTPAVDTGTYTYL